LGRFVRGVRGGGRRGKDLDNEHPTGKGLSSLVCTSNGKPQSKVLFPTPDRREESE